MQGHGQARLADLSATEACQANAEPNLRTARERPLRRAGSAQTQLSERARRDGELASERLGACPGGRDPQLAGFSTTSAPNPERQIALSLVAERPTDQPSPRRSWRRRRLRRQSGCGDGGLGALGRGTLRSLDRQIGEVDTAFPYRPRRGRPEGRGRSFDRSAPGKALLDFRAGPVKGSSGMHQTFDAASGADSRSRRSQSRCYWVNKNSPKRTWGVMPPWATANASKHQSIRYVW